jgi:hypothetical protein
VADPNQLVLLRFSLDMTSESDSNNLVVSNDSISLVVSPEGTIIAQSDKNIGYCTAFFGKPDEPSSGVSGSIEDDDQIFGPVPFVSIENGLSQTATDENGKYAMVTNYPLCPPGGFTYTGSIWATLNFLNFSPTGAAVYPYLLFLPDHFTCVAAFIPQSSLIELAVGQKIREIQASIYRPNIATNFFVDVMFLTGSLSLANLDGEAVAIGDTTRTSFSEPAADRIQPFYDFNGDGASDTVIRGQLEEVTNAAGVKEKVFIAKADGQLQGIFFDGQQDNGEAPDLVRIIDQEVRQEPVGILTSISTADLRNTDILFFRESTGQLVMERSGLKETEASRNGGQDVSLNADQVVYRAMLRGPDDFSYKSFGVLTNRDASFEQWASDSLLSKPFQQREADHLRSGEFVKIVAINRATGYMGTARVQLASAGDSVNGPATGLLSVTVTPITLTPPNLKIWAERINGVSVFDFYSLAVILLSLDLHER